jgi:glucosamine 6-phosphate synthetase-like amidotransferase/phosphosugar isomerase protein
MEYRGYDSAGIDVIFDSGLRTLRKVGRVANLVNAAGNMDGIGYSGIGQTTAWSRKKMPILTKVPMVYSVSCTMV